MKQKEEDLEFKQVSNAVIVNLLVKDMLKLRHSIHYGKLDPRQTMMAINAYNLEACVLESTFDEDNPHLMLETATSVKDLLNPEALEVLAPISEEVN